MEERGNVRTPQFRPTAPRTSVAQHCGLLKRPVGHRVGPEAAKGAAAVVAARARMVEV
jgi:hypothetical protein